MSSSAASVSATTPMKQKPFVFDPTSPDTEVVQMMRHFHRGVMMELATGRRKKEGEISYKYPNAFTFVATAVGMFLAVDLALAAGPFASDFGRDVLARGAPFHWGLIKGLTRGYVNLETIQRGIFNFVVGNSFTGNTLIGFATTAWLSIARVRDARLAKATCNRYGAAPVVGLQYAAGVFLCGMAQTQTLEVERRRVERLNRYPGVDDGGTVLTPSAGGSFAGAPRSRVAPVRATAEAVAAAASFAGPSSAHSVSSSPGCVSDQSAEPSPALMPSKHDSPSVRSPPAMVGSV